MIMLSILIPSIPRRKDILLTLLSEVNKQRKYCYETHPMLGEVEVIINDSKPYMKGGLSIGKKRESLVRQAGGKYLCFLDDDESISPTYVETLLRLCYEDKDVCTFRNISKFDNYWAVVDLGLGFENEQSKEGEDVKRAPWHICPVRSEFAKQYSFPDSNYGEDWGWFVKVLSNCKTEAKTNAVIHQYNYSIKTSEASKIVDHEKSNS